MKFLCNGCEKDCDFDLDFSLLIITPKNVTQRFCRECRKPKVGVPDIFWDGKPEENLADDPNTGQPRVFFSKGEKARYLQERGLMEAGDRVHGAPVQLSQNQTRKTDSRPQVQEALRKVKQMSPDYRRNEFLRIKKEAENAKR